jgi:hypothetical protein
MTSNSKFHDTITTSMMLRRTQLAPRIFILILLFGSFAVALPAHASASLTISAASINAAGATLTLTISGVSGSLSPSTGITGITLHADAATQYYFATTTITTSGSTVTVPISGFVLSGTSPTVDLSASSNLTDTGGDTPTGQTGVAITDNSTQTASQFPASDLFAIGFPETTTFGGLASTYVTSGNGDFFEGTFVGSSAQARIAVFGSAPVTISVDGISTTTLAVIPYLTWTWVPLFSGLSDAAHTVIISAPSASTLYLAQTNGIEVRGASPQTQTTSNLGHQRNCLQFARGRARMDSVRIQRCK